MFGRDYASYPDILMYSFFEMNEEYEEKIEANKSHFFLNLLKIYILAFGIPEIGFQIRSLYFKNIFSSFISQKHILQILDAGSGIGAYSFWLARLKKNAYITGGDIDANKLRFCKIVKKQRRIKNLNFIYLDVEKKGKEKFYDLIVSIDVLEHVKNYKYTLKNFHIMLKEDGYVYIHVPQPHQKRIFSSLKEWHHEGHISEGITKKNLQKTLTLLGFKIIVSKETYGFFGKLAWELNHMMLAKGFLLAGITFPFLYVISLLDIVFENNKGLGILILAQKKLLYKKETLIFKRVKKS